MRSIDVDVVVVGAGCCGLSAALELHRRGLSVVVLEARDRVGGKTDSVFDDAGRRIDAGGQFLCRDMPLVRRLAADAGTPLVHVDQRGAVVEVMEGERMVRRGGGGPFRSAGGVLDDLARFDVDHTMSVRQWIDGLAISTEVRAALAASLEGVWCHDLDTLSMAGLVASDRRTPLTTDELESFPADSMHSLALWMASELGERVVLGRPVTGIEVSGDAVQVKTNDGVLHCREVVVAVPPQVLGSMVFSPALPDPVTSAASRFEAGQVLKFVVSYDRAFWRDHDHCGTVQSARPGFYVTESNDSTSDPRLVAFVAGPGVGDWLVLAPEQRIARLLGLIAAAHGDEALQPRWSMQRDWLPDRWGGGGYCAVLTAGSDPAVIDVLREGIARVSFASTELALSFPGYVEGALARGAEVADVVAARLGVQLPDRSFS